MGRKNFGRANKQKKPWSWPVIIFIGMIGCLIASFLVPDFSQSFGTNKKEKSQKKRKNILSIDLNKTIERSAKAIKAKDFERAAKLATRAVNEYPDSWIGWLNLGIAKRFGEGVSGVEPAIFALQKAAALNPDMAEIQIYLSSALACTSHITAAKSIAFKALSLSPNSIEALSTASKVTNFTDFVDNGAQPLLDKILSILQLHESSTDDDDVNRLSPSQEATLRFALFKAFDENAEYSIAAKQLSTGNNVKQFLQLQLLALEGQSVGNWGKESSSALVGEIISAFDLPSSSSSDVSENYPLAYKLGLMNENDSSSSPSSLAVQNNETKFQNGVNYCKTLLTKKKKKKKKMNKEMDDDEQEEDEIVDDAHFVRPLVFIGMPRSGSTLLQQMLSAHPNVFEGEEYNFFSGSIQLVIEDVMKKAGVSKLSMSEQVAVLSSNVDALQELHLNYLSLLQLDVHAEVLKLSLEKKKEKNIGPFSFMSDLILNKNFEEKEEDIGPLYVIDKQLSNTWWAGALPPCSKVVLLRRHHMDLGFSNFKSNFPVGGYEYAYNQTELGWRIALTERLLNLWENIIPKENLISINYEDLVEDPQGTMKSIHKFLNLNYNASTTTPHLTNGVVTSPYGQNLRVPIEIQKMKSLKHWEKYASLLEEYIYAYDDAKKWIRYVMDGEGAMGDTSPQNWLARGAHFDELGRATQEGGRNQEEAKNEEADRLPSSSDLENDVPRTDEL